MHKSFRYLIALTSIIFGAGPLAVLLIHGTSNVITLDWGMAGLLLFDAFLSLLFFLQHSIMIRKGIRQRITNYIPDEYYGALYSISSGIFLLPIIGLWQKTPVVLLAADRSLSILIWIVLFMSVLGFFWGVNSLKSSFDPFGARRLTGRKHGDKARQASLQIRGAYLWMRHPLYFFVMVMIWACPVITPDRLLFNILWSSWIVIGAFLEERDLVSDFGEQYREYQAKVPMLIPCRIPARTP